MILNKSGKINKNQIKLYMIDNKVIQILKTKLKKILIIIKIWFKVKD